MFKVVPCDPEKIHRNVNGNGNAGVCEKTILQTRQRVGERAFRTPKSGGGEQSLLLAITQLLINCSDCCEPPSLQPLTLAQT